MSDDEFIARLEACTIPEDHFHHADHLHAAWLYLTRFPATDAIARCSEVLRRYVTSLGKPDRYHETITWAYLLLLNERIHRSQPVATWEQFAAAHSDLFDRKNSILLRYYREETLQSELARRVFVMPDRLSDAFVATRACGQGDRPLSHSSRPLMPSLSRPVDLRIRRRLSGLISSLVPNRRSMSTLPCYHQSANELAENTTLRQYIPAEHSMIRSST